MYTPLPGIWLVLCATSAEGKGLQTQWTNISLATDIRGKGDVIMLCEHERCTDLIIVSEPLVSVVHLMSIKFEQQLH